MLSLWFCPQVFFWHFCFFGIVFGKWKNHPPLLTTTGITSTKLLIIHSSVFFTVLVFINCLQLLDRVDLSSGMVQTSFQLRLSLPLFPSPKISLKVFVVSLKIAAKHLHVSSSYYFRHRSCFHTGLYTCVYVCVCAHAHVCKISQ